MKVPPRWMMSRTARRSTLRSDDESSRRARPRKPSRKNTISQSGSRILRQRKAARTAAFIPGRRPRSSEFRCSWLLVAVRDAEAGVYRSGERRPACPRRGSRPRGVPSRLHRPGARVCARLRRPGRTRRGRCAAPPASKRGRRGLPGRALHQARGANSDARRGPPPTRRSTPPRTPRKNLPDPAQAHALQLQPLRRGQVPQTGSARARSSCAPATSSSIRTSAARSCPRASSST